MVKIGLGGGCVGAMKRCIQLASEQSKTVKQFGDPFGEFGLVQEKFRKW